MVKADGLNQNKEIISRKDIVKFLAIIISNWYWLLILPALAFAISYIYTHRIQEIYAAKCQILLKSQETYDYQRQIYRGLGYTSAYASYEETASQMRVLKSSGLIEEVLEQLPLNVSYYIVGRLKITEIYEHMPFRVDFDDRSQAYSGMPFTLSIIDTSSFRLQYKSGGVNKDKVFKFGELILNDGLYLRIYKESNLNAASVGSLKLINYMFKVFKKGALIGKYKSAISVTNIDYTSIVEVTVQDQIPERAAKILETLSGIYVENTLDNQNEINANTLNYIDRQLEEVIDIINQIEIELESYKEVKNVLNLDKEENSDFGRLVEMEEDLRMVELDISATEDLITYLLKPEGADALLPPSLFVSSTDLQLQQRINELYAMRSEYNGMLESGTAENPSIKGMVERIDNLKQDIVKYLEMQQAARENRIKEINNEIAQLENKIKNIPKTQRQILNIQRRLQVNEELYKFLLSRRAETVIAKAGLIPETKVIESARATGIVYPDKLQMNLYALIMGFGLAIAIILIREVFFQKIKSVGQLQTVTNLPVLGGIPKRKEAMSTYRIQSGAEKSEMTQAFRMLRTNLQYFAPGNECSKVLVTSLMPGEGKTFTTINLASILAIAGKRVLVIDFDLHKPRLYKAMELPNDKGVSTFLIGKESMEAVIQKTDVDTLDVICSGPVPPNASELILNEKLPDMFAWAEQQKYDYVFLDTPPVSLITDALVLMNHSNINAFVLNSRTTSKTSVDYIEKMIDTNDLKYCTLVLNEEKISRLNYYYSRYGYGGYGYGSYSAYGSSGTDYYENK